MFLELLSFSISNNELFNKAIQIRFEVFTNEQKIDKNLDYDGLDFDAVHFLLSIDGKFIATARWRETDYGIKIERVSVLNNYRHLGYGFLLVKHILDDVLKSKKIIYLHSIEETIDFFKLIGFYVSGTDFVEFGKKHFKMIYKNK